MMRAPLATLCLFAVVACGDSTTKIDARISSDSSSAADAASVDAAPVSADASLKSCFSNYDCPDTESCVNTGNEAQCVNEPRGTGSAGVVCTKEQDCKSALCVEGTAAGSMFCSDKCNVAADCPALLPRCISVLGEKICVRAPPQ